jgi:hypothetical protein
MCLTMAVAAKPETLKWLKGRIFFTIPWLGSTNEPTTWPANGPLCRHMSPLFAICRSSLATLVFY